MSDCEGIISQLFIYPVKSCAGIALDTSQLKRTGLAFDREWVIVDQNGQFITQRQAPHMAWITPALSQDSLTLSAPTQESIALPLSYRGHSMRITVWRDTLAADDMGDEIANWLDRFLQIPGRHFRLVRFAKTAQRLSSHDWTAGVDAPNMFSDGYACLVVSQAALDLLNNRLEAHGYESVDMLRFRPNIVIKGFEAHDEDHLDSLEFAESSNGPALKLVKPCSRCAIPDIDPYTAQSTPEVSEILGSYRRLPLLENAICFGMNGIVTKLGQASLTLNMPVRANYKI